MHIAITGGTGFIGSYVVNELVKNNYKITLLARNPDKIAIFKSISNINMVKFDIRNYTKLKKIKKFDALILVALSWGDTGTEMIKNETISQVGLIENAINSGVKKIIFTSSTAALGPIFKTVNENTKLTPSDFYGASKGSVELFINAFSNYYKDIAFNIIRPGYTFGNPVVKGAPVEPDNRFKEIAKKVKQNKTVNLIKNDGTQFIWAGDLAKLYVKLLQSNYKNEIFFGLSKNFITWEQIAKWAFKISGKKPKIKLKDLNWSKTPPLYSVEKIKNYFGFEFDSTEKIKEHISYLLSIY
jgi:UDP-glucose 4-epimerase